MEERHPAREPRNDPNLGNANLVRASTEAERQLDCERVTAKKIDHQVRLGARRLEDGSYGFCEETGEPISLKPLRARARSRRGSEAQRRERFIGTIRSSRREGVDDFSALFKRWRRSADASSRILEGFATVGGTPALRRTRTTIVRRAKRRASPPQEARQDIEQLQTVACASVIWPLPPMTRASAIWLRLIVFVCGDVFLAYDARDLQVAHFGVELHLLMTVDHHVAVVAVLT